MSLSHAPSVVKFVQAGAGAGKTWNLTREVIGFAQKYREKEGVWPRVVLTTFTRKATQELKERLMLYCLEELPQALDFVQSSSHLSITTMHGLLSQFLTQKGSHVGLPGRFQFVTAKNLNHQRKKILKDLIEQGSVSRVLQGMGFRNLLNSLKDLEEYIALGDISPAQENDLLQAQQASCQMTHLELARLIDSIDWPDSESWETYRKELLQLNRLLVADHDWSHTQQLLSKELELLKMPRATKKVPGLEEENKESLKKLITQVKKWCDEEPYQPAIWPEQVQVWQDLHRLGQLYYQRLKSWKLEEALIETDDLELFSLQLIRQHPETATEYAKSIQAWFVDEFQDTSPRQLEVLEPLMQGSTVYMVGDPQQSIYLFRGSRSEVFYNQAEKVDLLKGDKTYLDYNYRSKPPLLGFFNQFFAKLPGGFRSMLPARQDDDKDCCVQILSENADQEAELSALVGQVSTLLSQGVRPRDICFLSRTREDLKLLERELNRLGFPVLSQASAQFYDRREIIDATALLRALLNPWDDQNLLTLLRTPWLGVPDDLLVTWCAQKDTSLWEICSRQEELAKAPSTLCYLKAQISKLNTQGLAYTFRQSLMEFAAIEKSWQQDPSGRAEANLIKLINLVEKNARKADLRLIDIVEEALAGGQLDDGSALGDAHSPSESDKISLMTIHASKGLQFAHVFIPFLNKRPRETTWQDLSIYQDEKLWVRRLPILGEEGLRGGFIEDIVVQDLKRREKEESLRVLYVAMTRAKQSLCLSWSGEPSKGSWGELVEQCLKGVDAHLFKREQQSAPEGFSWVQPQSQIRVRPPYQQLENRELVEIANDQQSYVSPLESLQRRHLGTQCHRLFEGLKNHSPQELRGFLDQWFGRDPQAAAEALDFVVESSSPPLLQLIREGEVEWAYMTQSPTGPRSGRIDLWGILDGRLWVADYKTGSPRNREQAFLQMSEYARVLKQHLNWNGEVMLLAIFPFAQQCFAQEFKGSELGGDQAGR